MTSQGLEASVKIGDIVGSFTVPNGENLTDIPLVARPAWGLSSISYCMGMARNMTLGTISLAVANAVMASDHPLHVRKDIMARIEAAYVAVEPDMDSFVPYGDYGRSFEECRAAYWESVALAEKAEQA